MTINWQHAHNYANVYSETGHSLFGRWGKSDDEKGVNVITSFSGAWFWVVGSIGWAGS